MFEEEALQAHILAVVQQLLAAADNPHVGFAGTASDLVVVCMIGDSLVDYCCTKHSNDCTGLGQRAERRRKLLPSLAVPHLVEHRENVVGLDFDSRSESLGKDPHTSQNARCNSSPSRRGPLAALMVSKDIC